MSALLVLNLTGHYAARTHMGLPVQDERTRGSGTEAN